MKKEYRRRFAMAISQWFLYHERNIAFNKCYWMGIRACKNPLDAWIYQEIIYEVKPDIIIEIGSWEGGSTLYFANLLDLLGKGLVISIDIDRTNYRAKHNRIVTITGDSSSLEIVSKVAKLCENKSILVVHDGCHSKEEVLKDLQLYSNFVSIGSYFIVEDGIIDLLKPWVFGFYVDGPLAAVEEFLSKNSKFVIDRERERYILTHNPKGFLRRIQ